MPISIGAQLSILEIVAECTITVPGLPPRVFEVGEEILPGSVFYFAAFWSGYAEPTGVIVDPIDPETATPLMLQGGEYEEGNIPIYDAETGLWIASPFVGGGGEGAGVASFNGRTGIVTLVHGDLPIAANGESSAVKVVRANDSRLSPVVVDDAYIYSIISDEETDSNGVIGSTAQYFANQRAAAVHTHLPADVTGLTEAVQDIVGALIVAGTNVTVNYDDVANTFTINSSGGGGGGTDSEVVRDTIGGALVAGAGVQITVNDAGDTITIASTAVLPTRTISTGTGLLGGGDLSANRTLTPDFGTGAGKVTQGNDSRLSDARTPTAHSHAIADLPSAADAESSATKLVKANDSRLSNSRTPTTHAHVPGDITGLTEAVQDVVGAMLIAGTNVTVNYDDVANTFTINSSGGGGGTDAEVVRDTIGGALVAGAGIQITVNDAGDTITIANTGVLTTRQVATGTGLLGGGDLSANRTLTPDFGTGAGKVTQGNDSRLSDARTPLAHNHPVSEITGLPTLVPQAEAEEGIATTARYWSAERVAQAIAAIAETIKGDEGPVGPQGPGYPQVAAIYTSPPNYSALDENTIVWLYE
jgi:hypothetical protein